MSRCPNCQVPESLACAGLTVPRFCELVDPAHRDYRPAYHQTLLGIATAQPSEHPPAPAPAGPCGGCGGTGAMPGVFDNIL
jgi:hypothetical protein